MAIAAQPPRGGIIAEVGGKSRPLLLRNAEIERFEAQHNIGIFAVGRWLWENSEKLQARHLRDLVALGLVGGGLPDRAADDIIAALPPSENTTLRTIAVDLVTIAFLPENAEKKSVEAGSSKKKSQKATSGASQSASAKQSQPD
mgnify:CR=1 FL=1